MWNDHWSIMKPANFIIWFSFNINFRFSIKWCSRPKRLNSKNMWSTPAVWKQYNKMAVLHFFLVNSTQIYILFSLLKSLKSLKYLHHGVNTENDRTKVLGCNTDLDRLYDRKRERHSPEYSASRTNSFIHSFIHLFILYRFFY